MPGMDCLCRPRWRLYGTGGGCGSGSVVVGTGGGSGNVVVVVAVSGGSGLGTVVVVVVSGSPRRVVVDNGFPSGASADGCVVTVPDSGTGLVTDDDPGP